MKRTIINIDESKCDGCGNCVEGCHEGALQMIDGKARLVSELFCDGLGACIGECPQGAITLEEREAQPYDEIAVMDRISGKGKNTIIAHMKHLRDHNEMKYFNQAIDYIEEKNIEIDLTEINKKPMFNIMEKHLGGSGCPGSKSMD
jgi:ferredoxin